MDSSVNILRECSFFSSLNDEELRLLFAQCEKIELKEGAFLFHENEVGDALYILLTGKLVAITQQKEKENVIGFIRPGEIVGELSIFSKQPRSASIKALFDSSLIRLKREAFQSLCQKCPQILW